MPRRDLATVVSTCTLAVLMPAAAPAAAGPPDADHVVECLTYGGPPTGPVDPVLSAIRCLV